MGTEIRTVVIVGRILLREGTQEPPGVLEIFTELTWVVFTKVYTYSHIYKNSLESYSILPLSGFLTFISYLIPLNLTFPLYDGDNTFDTGWILRLKPFKKW